MELVTLALSKGKLFDETLQVLQRAGLAGPELEADTRSLLIDAPERGMRYILTRPTDVPTYVEHGAADLGIVGKDTLLEGRQPVYELLDLGYSRCRFVLAAPERTDPARLLDGSANRCVATKFPHLTEDYFRRRGIQVEVITLHGAIELAPAVGLADMIVDITQTGRTLKENRLAVLDEIEVCTARLIANRASYRLKQDRLAPMVQALREATAAMGFLPVGGGLRHGNGQGGA